MSNSPTSPQPAGWFGRNRRVLLIGGPVLLLLAALFFYMLTGRYVSTDDAYVQSARVDISTEVSGRIAEIDVHDNQLVRKGQVLFRLDPARFRIAVADAQAQLSAAQIKVLALRADWRQRQADEAAARSALAFASREFDRQTRLQAQGISSRAQLDQAKTNFQSAQQQLAAAQQQTASALADLGGNADAPADSLPIVRQAQATLDHALLELSYTVVHAPIDGIVTKVEQIQVGDHINAAAPLFALMSKSDIWVEANFKETDLTHMRPGQSATFAIDAYPGRTFTGKVTSTSPGTGSSFSLLPPENSSGNWVKVVQRLPVRLSIDSNGDVPLAAGMSVVAEVDTQHRRWN
ncbi:MAG TPA: HlyD family secretion protein [Rhizomicrobium sp.]|jgi:membrane fusion protein (multidrug efflux system)